MVGVVALLVLETAILFEETRKDMTAALKSFWGLFGKNQWIGLSIYATVIVVACVGTYTSTTTTMNDLLGFLQWFAPSAVATLTIPSAAVKMRAGSK